MTQAERIIAGITRTFQSEVKPTWAAWAKQVHRPGCLFSQPHKSDGGE